MRRISEKKAVEEGLDDWSEVGPEPFDALSARADEAVDKAWELESLAIDGSEETAYARSVDCR